MSAIADDIIRILDPSLAEAAGTDLFEGDFTENPANQVVVSHVGGSPPDREMSASLTAPPLERAQITVMVRNTALGTARTKAQAIHALLDNMQGVTGNSGTSILYVEALDGEPHLMGQDDNLRWVYAANYQVQKGRG